MIDWRKILRSAKEDESIKRRIIEESEWNKKFITDEVKSISVESQRGFDYWNGCYGSEAVLIYHILKLEKRIEQLEEIVKNNKVG